MKNENPYVTMLNRIDSYLSTLISEQIKIKKEKEDNIICLNIVLMSWIWGLLISFVALNTKITFFILELISSLSTIFCATIIKKISHNIKFKKNVLTYCKNIKK